MLTNSAKEKYHIEKVTTKTGRKMVIPKASFKQLIADYPAQNTASRETGVGRDTLRTWAKELGIDWVKTNVKPELRKERTKEEDSHSYDVKRKQAELERVYKESLLENAQLKKIISYNEAISGTAPAKVFTITKGSGRSESVANFLLSDIHLDEVVKPESVDGLNEYNPDIASKRLNRFVEGAIRLTNIERHGTEIKDAVLYLMGDSFTGFIHKDEGALNNAMAPIPAAMEAENLIYKTIKSLDDYGEFKTLTVVCMMGNHTRTTDKMTFATAWQYSYEWWIYNHLAKLFSNNKRIKFIIPKSYYYIVDVLGHKVRVHHGDAIRYSDGVGGLTIPTIKAINNWNRINPVDYDFIGHLHQFHDGGNFLVNGSVIGYNSFAMKRKFPFEKPRQTFCLINQKYGKTLTTPIYLD